VKRGVIPEGEETHSHRTEGRKLGVPLGRKPRIEGSTRLGGVGGDASHGGVHQSKREKENSSLKTRLNRKWSSSEIRKTRSHEKPPRVILPQENTKGRSWFSRQLKSLGCGRKKREHDIVN